MDANAAYSIISEGFELTHSVFWSLPTDVYAESPQPNTRQQL